MSQLIYELLGCRWGHVVTTPDDTEPCRAQAVKIIVVHEGDVEVSTRSPRSRGRSQRAQRSSGSDTGHRLLLQAFNMAGTELQVDIVEIVVGGPPIVIHVTCPTEAHRGPA